MKTSIKIVSAICIVAMLFSIFSIAATAKIDDNDEDYRIILLAGKFYKIYESAEITGDTNYLLDKTDYVAIKMNSVTSAFGGYTKNMDTPNPVESTDTNTVNNLDTSSDISSDDVVNSDTVGSGEDTPLCENGVCYVDSVLDEETTVEEVEEEEVTPTVFDDEEAITFFETNTAADATSIGDTDYPYSIKTKLDEAGVDNTIWTVTTKEGNTIYLNVFELESGKQLKAFTYAGKPREVTTLSDGKEIMAKRLLCKTCNAKRSFGVVETISK